jgi:hypothetical protein
MSSYFLLRTKYVANRINENYFVEASGFVVTRQLKLLFNLRLVDPD